MDETDHHLIVGKDAQRFARSMGFKIEDDLNTERSRDSVARVEAPDRSAALSRSDQARGGAARGRPRDDGRGLIDPNHFYGTINCNGVNAKGEICGVTTTSGLAWKIPGRVGDSPILGAGLYVDGDVGAAGSTGRGEANLFNLTSFLIVEEMRRGKAPEGRRHGGAEAASRPTRSRSAC